MQYSFFFIFRKNAMFIPNLMFIPNAMFISIKSIRQNPDSQIDHDASSNLLPVLSTKSIALTNILTQVLLNQYKNTRLGETNDAAMGLDMKRLVWSDMI